MSKQARGKVYAMEQRLKTPVPSVSPPAAKRTVVESESEDDSDEEVVPPTPPSKSPEVENEESGDSSSDDDSSEEEEEEEQKPKKQKVAVSKPVSSKRSREKTAAPKKSKKPKPKSYLDTMTASILNHVSEIAGKIESNPKSNKTLAPVVFNSASDVANADNIRRLYQCKLLLSSGINFIQPYIDQIEKDLPEPKMEFLKEMRLKFTNVCNKKKQEEQEKPEEQ